MDVTISPADINDLPALVEVNFLAYYPEVITRFTFTTWPNDEAMRIAFRGRISDRLSNPNSFVFKAVDVATGEIVGCVCWTLESGEDVQSPTVNIASRIHQHLNMEMMMAMADIFKKIEDLKKGVRHYYVSTMAVTPKSQGKGIGDKLLRHCFESADRDGLPTWLSAFPGSRDFYLKIGFIVVDHADLDLNEWDKFRYRGYGIYRSYAMVRQPNDTSKTEI